MRDGLTDASFAVDDVQDGHAAELALGNDAYELVVLDLGLPSRNGLAVLASLRRNGNHVPVIIATVRDTVADRISGLNAGADDYLLKPFDLDELVARVRALLGQPCWHRCEPDGGWRDCVGPGTPLRNV